MSTEIEKLYKYLREAGRKPNLKLKSPEMLPLLTRLSEGYIEERAANYFATTKLEILKGPVSKTLDTNTQYDFKLISLPKITLNTGTYMVTKRKGIVSLWGTDTKRYNILSNEWVCAIVIKATLLPLDLRQWPKMYIQAHLNNIGVASSFRHPESFAPTYKSSSNVSRAIRYRRQINYLPGRAQRKRLKQQQENHQNNIDVSFSFDD